MSKRIPLRRCSNGHRCWANLNLSSGIWQLRTWRMKSMTNWCRSTLPRRISRGTTSPQTCSSPSPEPGRQRAARWAPSLPRQSPTLFVRLVTSSSRNKKISTFTCRRMKMWNLSFVTFVRKHSSLKTNWGRVQPFPRQTSGLPFCFRHFKQFNALQKHRQIHWSWPTSRWWHPSRATCPRRPPSPAWAGRTSTGCARATTPGTAGRRSWTRGRRWRGTTSSSRRDIASSQEKWWKVSI